ncbi:N-acetyltransferase [Microbulbifer flavimaris]|uniref:N-acetyltransferase n=1 Tax=Microbulbifer flavimaris TaxID=1781068 RepID=A0ABX4HZF3_9GAMM|nr:MULTISPECIES: arsinothricin resistance N-acetyltransferase ArsN1 family B [Microbulbifer]KUJ82906.1 phosphinothricin acetyltransferase [Microbulbifer sp. ZGT114]PCO05087.1 N-acetyltransferase [Microbulbifer flavimaris]
MIRSARRSDAASVVKIYNHYVEKTAATFETQPLAVEDMASRIVGCQRDNLPWLVAEDAGEVIGYCYATKWKGRAAYRYSVEASIYLDASLLSRGWGTRLYGQLLKELESLGIHAVICGITLPNAASVALHEKLGMEKVAHFKEVGHKFGAWIDVGYWQRLLNTEDR